MSATTINAPIRTTRDNFTQTEDNNCGICLKPMVDATTIYPCTHKTCYECFVKWFEQRQQDTSCPFCRRKVEEISHNPTRREKISVQSADGTSLPSVSLQPSEQREIEKTELERFCDDLRNFEQRINQIESQFPSDEQVNEEFVWLQNVWSESLHLNERLMLLESHTRTQQQFAIIRDLLWRLGHLRSDIQDRKVRCEERRKAVTQRILSGQEAH